MQIADLEARGLAVTAGVLRFAYSAGGDGESDIKVDLREVAAFFRDPQAVVVSCVLLPFSASASLHMTVCPPTLSQFRDLVCWACF